MAELYRPGGRRHNTFRLRSLGQWQRDGKSSPFAELAGNVACCTERPSNALHDAQTQADASRPFAPRPRTAIKRLEHMSQLVPRKTRTVVLDEELRVASRARHAQHNRGPQSA